MKVLVVTDNASLFDDTSLEHKAMLQYAKRVEELHVVVMTEKKEKRALQKIGDKIYLYPTNSWRTWLFAYDAVKVIKSNVVWKFELIADLVVTEDSFSCIAATYWIWRKYRKNFLINCTHNVLSVNSRRNVIAKRFTEAVYDEAFARAAAIRVTNEPIGEAILALNPELENTIYVLPVVSETKDEQAAHSDIRKKFPQFNIFLVFIKDAISAVDLKKAVAVVNELRHRYPRIGLIVGSNTVWSKHVYNHLPPHVIAGQFPLDPKAYFEAASVYIDTSHNAIPDPNLSEALRAGCPAVVSLETAGDNVLDGQNGFALNPDNPKQFARKVIDIIETPGLRERISLLRYDLIDLYGKNLEEYYDRLIDLWQRSQTEKAEEANVSEPEEPKPELAYTAFTLGVIKKVKRIVEGRLPERRRFDNNENLVFDVDAIKTTFTEALAELEADVKAQKKR